MSLDFGVNQGLVEELYLRWCDNPRSVDESWQRFFESLAEKDAPVAAGTHGTVPGAVIAPIPPRTGRFWHCSRSVWSWCDTK